MPGSTGNQGPGSQLSLGAIIALLVAGVTAILVTTLTISGSAVFNAATAPSGEAAKTKLWHDSTTDKLMSNVANGGSKYIVDSGGFTANYIPKASAVGTVGNSSITDDGTTVSTTEPVDVKRNGIAATTTDGLVLSNNTAATVGTTVQYSPRLRLRSNVWDTDGSSDTWDWWLESQGTSAGTTVGVQKWYYSKNGAAGTAALTLDSDGNFTSARIIGTSRVQFSNGQLTSATMTRSSDSYTLRSVWHLYSWTNAMVVAAGDTITTFDVTVATLPAKTVVKKAYLVVSTAGTNMGGATLTATLGTDAEFDNYLVSSNLLAAANTVYGDADAEVGSSLPGGGLHVEHLPSWTATTAVKVRFGTDGAGGKDLADVLTCTGAVYLLTETLP